MEVRCGIPDAKRLERRRRMSHNARNHGEYGGTAMVEEWNGHSRAAAAPRCGAADAVARAARQSELGFGARHKEGEDDGEGGGELHDYDSAIVSGVRWCGTVGHC